MMRYFLGKINIRRR